MNVWVRVFVRALRKRNGMNSVKIKSNGYVSGWLPGGFGLYIDVLSMFLLFILLKKVCYVYWFVSFIFQI